MEKAMKRRDLPFSFELKLPLDMATETLAFLGRKGRGKTYGAQRWFELLHHAGVQCVALDPVGNWWSLRVGKDGKSPGLPVYVFGGPRGDVPILPDAGAFIARVIVEKGISVILDVSRFRKAERKRFMTAFAEEFFHLKKDAVSPVHFFVEEAHKFVPQLVRDGEEQMLGAMEDIIRIGRNYGIGASLISQRSASVNKDVLSQVECLVAYQTGGKHDKKAIKDWVEENDEEGVALLAEMKSLQQGEALFYSPAALKVFQKIHITAKETLDASSTPKIGSKARKPVKLAKVDLEGIHESMKEVVASAEANDVTALKKKVKALEAELVKRVPATKVKEIKTKEMVPLINHRQVQRIEKLSTRITKDTNRLDRTIDFCNQARDRLSQAQQAIVSEIDNLRREIQMRAKKIEASVTSQLPPELVHEARKMSMQQRPKIGAPPVIGVQKHPPVRNLLRERPVEQPPSVDPSGVMNPARQRILDTIALLNRLDVEVERDTLAAWYGVHPNNKGLTNNLGALRTAGYLDGLRLTAVGQGYARDIAIPSQKELHEKILSPLNASQRKIMDVLIENDELEREQLAEILGVHPNNKGLTNNLGRLRSRQLATKGWPIKAGDVLRLQSA
jgi:hypothetical protein